MNWDDVSISSRDWMEFLGNFSPTANEMSREVKGYMVDVESGECGKTYLSSQDLREIAKACGEVASWLDARAGIAMEDPYLWLKGM